MSDPLKDLIIKMLAFDPTERLSIVEVLNHPWMTDSDTKSPQELVDEVIEDHKSKDEENPDLDSSELEENPVYKSGNDSENPLELRAYIRSLKEYTEFFSTSDFSDLWLALSLFVTHSEHKYKLLDGNYGYVIEDENLNAEIEILEVNESKHCVQLRRRKGCGFIEHGKLFKDALGYFKGLANSSY